MPTPWWLTKLPVTAPTKPRRCTHQTPVTASTNPPHCTPPGQAKELAAEFNRLVKDMPFYTACGDQAWLNDLNSGWGGGWGAPLWWGGQVGSQAWMNDLNSGWVVCVGRGGVGGGSLEVIPGLDEGPKSE